MWIFKATKQQLNEINSESNSKPRLEPGLLRPAEGWVWFSIKLTTKNAPNTFSRLSLANWGYTEMAIGRRKLVLLILMPEQNRLLIATTRGTLSISSMVSFSVSCCFTSTEARWPIRDGDRLSGKGTTEWKLDRGNRPKKTGETVDRRQNGNGSQVKAVSPRHCPATDLCTAQLLFQLLCWTESLSLLLPLVYDEGPSGHQPVTDLCRLVVAQRILLQMSSTSVVVRAVLPFRLSYS